MLAGEKPEAAVLRVNAAEGRIESFGRRKRLSFFFLSLVVLRRRRRKKNQKSDFSTSSLRAFSAGKKKALKSKIQKPN